MKNQVKIFFTALIFYTRIPVPQNIGFSSENLNKATRYFPLIGIITGSIGAGVYYGLSFVAPVSVAVIFCLAAMIFITGAFHEDAMADFCDGFGGGYSKEQILYIMKDSRIGTFGAVSLVLLLLSKFALLSAIIPSDIPVILISAHSVSRINPVIMIYTSQYVRNDENSKFKPIGKKSSVKTLLTAIMLGVIPLYFIHILIIPFIVVIQVVLLLYFRKYVHRKIGGYTGDVLGTLQQLSEISFYLAYIISFKLI